MKRDDFVKEHGFNPTAEVIGIVNTDRYIADWKAKEEKAEKLNRKRALETTIKKQIEKYQTMEFYKKIAEEYKEINPELAEAVKELEKLEEEV